MCQQSTNKQTNQKIPVVNNNNSASSIRKAKENAIKTSIFESDCPACAANPLKLFRYIHKFNTKNAFYRIVGIFCSLDNAVKL